MVRRAYVILVVLYVILAGSTFFYLMNENASSEFDITVVYQSHSWTETFTDHDHNYSNITINAQVTVSNYENVFESFRVGSYPFRIDVSQWKNGDSVTIGSSSYDVSSSGGSWRARRVLGGADYVNLFYDRTTGAFLSSYSKVSGSGVDFMDDYIREITIESSNLGSLIAAITGSNIVKESLGMLLLIGIFIEVPLILWLNKKRKVRKAKQSEKITNKSVKHGNPGIGATKSSTYVPLK